MCYSGECPYEDYMGDCSIPKKIYNKWFKEGRSPCLSEWLLEGEEKKYYEIKKEIENELNNEKQQD